MKKKILSILLVFCMILTAVPMMVFSASAADDVIIEQPSADNDYTFKVDTTGCSNVTYKWYKTFTVTLDENRLITDETNRGTISGTTIQPDSIHYAACDMYFDVSDLTDYIPATSSATAIINVPAGTNMTGLDVSTELFRACDIDALEGYDEEKGTDNQVNLEYYYDPDDASCLTKLDEAGTKYLLKFNPYAIDVETDEPIDRANTSVLNFWCAFRNYQRQEDLINNITFEDLKVTCNFELTYRSGNCLNPRFTADYICVANLDGKEVTSDVVHAVHDSHTYDQEDVASEYATGVAATCSHGSEYYKSCVCDVASTTDTFYDDDTTAHSFGEYVSDNNATCGKDGTKTATCSVCNAKDTVTDEGSATGLHTIVTIPAVAATCTTPGSTEGSKCSVCNEILVAPEVIPALGHKKADAVKENEVAATCTKEGSYDSVVYCSRCNEELSRETIPTDKLAHTEEIIPAVAATCTTPGSTEGSKCSVCNEILVAPEVIPALGHVDENGDNICDRCSADLTPASDETGCHWCYMKTQTTSILHLIYSLVDFIHHALGVFSNMFD